MNVDWMDLVVHILLPIALPGIISLWLYYAQSKRDQPKTTAEINGTRSKTIESLSTSLDLITDQYREILAKDLAKDKVISEIQTELAAEIVSRKQMEKQLLELRREHQANLDGIQILILQMETLHINPAWRPQN